MQGLASVHLNRSIPVSLCESKAINFLASTHLDARLTSIPRAASEGRKLGYPDFVIVALY